MKKEESTLELKKSLISASREAVKELIAVAKKKIFDTSTKRYSTEEEDDSPEAKELAADRLKNAAAAKKTAIFDAFDILDRIDVEEEAIKAAETSGGEVHTGGFAERRSKK